jgi:hypothetical protein
MRVLQPVRQIGRIGARPSHDRAARLALAGQQQVVEETRLGTGISYDMTIRRYGHVTAAYPATRDGAP